MKTVDIELNTPIKIGGEDLAKVTLREPIARDFFDLGETGFMTRTETGSVVYIHNEETIRLYMKRCITSPNGVDVDALSLADTMRLRDAVLGFFEAARVASSTSQQSSSSARSDG
jgi:hypothetical protein